MATKVDDDYDDDNMTVLVYRFAHGSATED